METLARARRTGDPSKLIQIGELMTASHWSYGQRCGLGSPSADLLVSLIKEHGQRNGIHGAKITGRGGGGTICVAMEPGEAAQSSLRTAFDVFAAATGQFPTVTEGGSTPGVLCAPALVF